MMYISDVKKSYTKLKFLFYYCYKKLRKGENNKKQKKKIMMMVDKSLDDRKL